MRTSQDRILTTHVGSLPRSEQLADILLRKVQGEADESRTFSRVIADSVTAAVRNQIGEQGEVGSSTSTNLIEHPELVAQRIGRYTDMVGKKRVVAGTDCGFGTFAA